MFQVLSTFQERILTFLYSNFFLRFSKFRGVATRQSKEAQRAVRGEEKRREEAEKKLRYVKPGVR